MNNELGNTIKNNRIRKGLSQIDLSKITGVDSKTISLIERGIRRKPKMETLFKLGNVLDCIDIRLFYLAGYTNTEITEGIRFLEDDTYEYNFIIILKGKGIISAGDVNEASEYAEEDLKEVIESSIVDRYDDIKLNEDIMIITDFGNQK